MAHTNRTPICIMLTMTERTVEQGITDLAAFARAVCQTAEGPRPPRMSRSPDRPRFKKKNSRKST